MIKVRNLPQWTEQPYSMHVKPVFALALMGLAGLVLLIMKNALSGIGVILVLLSVFSLLLMPDRLLLQVGSEYIVLYNHRDISECTIVYWDELVNWQYEYHKGFDILALSLTDGSTQTIELYSKRPIARFMNQFAPGKEVKNARRKEG